MNVVKATNIDELKHVALEWKATCNASQFGLKIDDEYYFAELETLILQYEADLFLLMTDDDKVVGYMGVNTFNSPLSYQRCAVEHHWYVMEAHRGKGSMRLLIAVKDWAKEQGCSHLILNASTLASGMHDKVCEFYRSMGFKKFETSYIQEII